MAYCKGDTKTFVNKAIKRWGNRYDYSQVRYINSRTPVLIFCHRHQHTFSQTPKAHFAAKHNCCPICAKEVAGSFQNQWREVEKKVMENDTIDKTMKQYHSLLDQILM